MDAIISETVVFNGSGGKRLTGTWQPEDISYIFEKIEEKSAFGDDICLVMYLLINLWTKNPLMIVRLYSSNLFF